MGERRNTSRDEQQRGKGRESAVLTSKKGEARGCNFGPTNLKGKTAKEVRPNTSKEIVGHLIAHAARMK